MCKYININNATKNVYEHILNLYNALIYLIEAIQNVLHQYLKIIYLGKNLINYMKSHKT